MAGVSCVAPLHEPANLDLSKQEIRRYVASHAYDRDLETVAEQANRWIQRRVAAGKAGERLAGHGEREIGDGPARRVRRCERELLAARIGCDEPVGRPLRRPHEHVGDLVRLDVDDFKVEPAAAPGR